MSETTNNTQGGTPGAGGTQNGQAGQSGTGGQGQGTTAGQGQGAAGAAGEAQGQPPAYTQADLDRAVSKAIETREAKLRGEAEAAKLEAQGEYKKLLEQERAERQRLTDEMARATHIAEAGLGRFKSVLGHVPVAHLGEATAAIKAAVEEQVAAQIAERLKNGNTTLPAGTGAPTGPITPAQVAKMSKEQLEAFLNAQGLKV